MRVNKSLLLFALLAFLPAAAVSCKEQVHPEEEEPARETELVALKSRPVVVSDWVFEKRPEFVYDIENGNAKAVEASFEFRISTDRGVSVATINETAEIKPGTQRVSFTTPEDLQPGYYNLITYIDGKRAKGFNFGISPFKIVSAPDLQPDFNGFWETALAQLSGVEMNAVLTEIPSKSTSAQKVYLVEMQSVPNGLDGEPVIIRGYFLEPTDGQKHPVLIHFYGYDTLKNPSFLNCPSGSGNPQFTEFYLSHRGQYINHRNADRRTEDGKGDFENIYGDWFAYQFGNRDAYYYRGAFLDCVQAVHFMATRPTSDMNNLFAEGSSQGGALSYAAAALSDYPFTAIAPCVAFLGDYPDYFKIVSWPGNVAFSNKGDMTDEQMYAFLSYFDTKNLATRISCAVIACSGLQDGTCPPHTNIAPFNNLLSTDKEFYFYPEMQHSIPTGWDRKYTDFFKARMK